VSTHSSDTLYAGVLALLGSWVCLVRVWGVDCRIQGGEIWYVGFLSSLVCLVRLYVVGRRVQSVAIRLCFLTHYMCVCASCVRVRASKIYVYLHTFWLFGLFGQTGLFG